METLFIRILNMSISSGWMILAVTAVRLLLKKAPRWISAALWGLVGLRLVMPFTVSTGFSLIPSSEVVDPHIGYAEIPAINSGVSVIDQAINPILGTSLAASPENSANPMQIWLFVLCIVWITGIIALLIYGAISCLRLRRTVDEAALLQDNVWICDRIQSPFILGVFKPRIYLPSDLNEAERAYVLAHEYAHLKRKDHLWKLIGFLILTIHWFNPLVWLAYILLCRDIEMACDEKVIRDLEMPEKKAYANALVSCSLQRHMVLACPLAFGEVGVKERVRGVLNYQKPAFWLIIAAVLISLVVAVCFLTDPKDKEQDLSFLNYKNAVSLIGQNGVEYVINYPVSGSEIQIGDTDDREFAQYLENCHWTKKRLPPQHPASPGSIQFVIEEGYRITVYQKPRIASVQFEDQVRYYNTGPDDYASALALLRTKDTAAAAFQGRILNIQAGPGQTPSYLVEVIEGGDYFKAGDQITFPLQNADSSPEPVIGDVIEVSFAGNVLETYPMQLTEVLSIHVIRDPDHSDSSQYDRVPCVMVDGKLYLDTGMDASGLIPLSPASSFDGSITSEVDSSELPAENGQSNFGTDYGYKWIDDDHIAIYIDQNWRLFTHDN